ncbi:MAG: hypothetical protein H6737_05210 [Alphaproteobacteria bacterium]|nr:hypothetical protein [Alphaproteobacteria bacterium]
MLPREEPRLKRHSAIVALLFGCGPHVPEHASSDACVDCHATAVAEWSESRHAVAFANPVFQTSWSEARSPWCLTCHQPEQGVDCATCHGPAPRTCEDCHDFDLPREIGGAPSGTRGQSTAEEWRGSGAAEAGLGCVDCHPPHHPIGGNDAERVRATVAAVVRADGDAVSATLVARDIGHAFPTGDPFRRLQLTICADLACRRPVATEVLERRLARTTDGGWAVARDSRIPAPAEGLVGTRTFELHAPGARSWQLALHLTDPRHAGELGDRAGYVVATGLVEGE